MSVSDVDSENRLLASLIEYNDYVFKVQPILFSGERVALCKAIQQCYTTYGNLSYEGVERFYGRELPQQFLAANVVKPEALIDKLSMFAEKRQLVQIEIEVEKLINQSHHDTTAVQDVLASFKPVLTTRDTTLTYGVAEFVSDLQRKRNGQYKFLKTGLNFLDYMLGGEWPRQALSIVIGLPGSGKSLLVSNSMLNMALLPDPIPSLFISLEMVKSRLVSRMISTLKSIDGLKLRQGDVTEEELLQIEEGIQHIQRLPMFIDDRPNLNVHDIISQMRKHKEVYGTDVVFVDYLQIINSDASENTSELLGDITQKIRNAAVELDMAAVVLSQQNRDHETHGTRSILGSGRVGHIADVVFEIKSEETKGDLKICTLVVHKNRDGPCAQYSIPMEPNYFRFVN